jgi:hypothetical protein
MAPPRPVIALCAWNRPDYTRQALAALRECRGIADALLLPRVEPGHEDVIALCRAVDFCEVQVTVNPVRLGVNRNAVTALQTGFAHSDFVIYVEDDILLSPDALEFYAWADARYQADDRVFSVTAYNRAPDYDQPFATGLRSWFHSWGCATWRNRWTQVAAELWATPTSYDTWLTEQWVRPRGLLEAYPVLGRCQNIGEVRSVPRASARANAAFAVWHRQNQRVARWAGEHGPFHGTFATPEEHA